MNYASMKTRENTWKTSYTSF